MSVCVCVLRIITGCRDGMILTGLDQVLLLESHIVGHISIQSQIEVC